ncbi:MAG: UDP-N-acetylmuramoyl-L-alanine--D-glutamate ligase [Bdellovibrionales bacterium]
MLKELSEIKGKKIAVIGAGRTGISLAKFLTRYGAEVLISDHKSEAELVNSLEEIENLPLKIELEGNNPNTLSKQDYVILSPGVSPHLNLFEHLKKCGVKITGEFEFVSQFIKEPMVVVTGTNGKTTVVTLAELFLKKSGVNVWCGGNYKQPVSEYLCSGEKADVLLIEASSFMLEHVENMVPNHIVFTNLAQNHLDRYNGSMETYINAKKRIFKNIDRKVTSILNADNNVILNELARDPSVQRGRIFYFSRKKSFKPQIMNIGGAVMIDGEICVRTSPEVEFYNLKNVQIKGPHSYENIMAAILIAKEYGGTWQHIQRGIDEYKGRTHRLEYVRKVGGVSFYNDSKATNVHAVSRALEAFDDNVILIMGGKDVGLNYKSLSENIRRKVKTLILVGEAKEIINRHIGDDTETFLIGTFDEAVFIAYHKSRINDVVLLSPGCPSFDSFDSYVERGNHFKYLINQFK